jgi:exosome complex protein LRP1
MPQKTMMGYTSPEQALLQLASIKKTTKKLKKHLQKYLDETTTKNTEDAEPLERAKANLNLAYISAALFYMLLRVHGVETSGHPIMEELQRIKERFQVLRKLIGQEDTRSLVIDGEATGRILAATLKDLSADKKRKLRKRRKTKQ